MNNFTNTNVLVCRYIGISRVSTVWYFLSTDFNVEVAISNNTWPCSSDTVRWYGVRSRAPPVIIRLPFSTRIPLSIFRLIGKVISKEIEKSSRNRFDFWKIIRTPDDVISLSMNSGLLRVYQEIEVRVSSTFTKFLYTASNLPVTHAVQLIDPTYKTQDQSLSSK
jgi:hypothetical protein